MFELTLPTSTSQMLPKQVKIMGNLYEKVRGVIIWVCPDNDEKRRSSSSSGPSLHQWMEDLPLPEDITEGQQRLLVGIRTTKCEES